MNRYIDSLRKLAATTINTSRKQQQMQATRQQHHKQLSQYANPYADDHFAQDGSFQDTARASQHAQHLNTQFKPVWQRYNNEYTKLKQEHASRPDNWKPGVSKTYQRNVKQLYRKYHDQLQRYHSQYDHSGYFQTTVDRHIDLDGQYAKPQLDKMQQAMRKRYPQRNFTVRMQQYKDNNGKPVYMPTVIQGTRGLPGYYSYGYASWRPQQGQTDRVYLSGR